MTQGWEPSAMGGKGGVGATSRYKGWSASKPCLTQHGEHEASLLVPSGRGLEHGAR